MAINGGVIKEPLGPRDAPTFTSQELLTAYVDVYPIKIWPDGLRHLGGGKVGWKLKSVWAIR